ncbi:MAG: lysophospholipid acyltransferase family protein [Thermoanaerobaculia bacterium]
MPGEARRYPWFVAPAALLVRVLLATVLRTCRVVSIVGERHLGTLAESKRPAVFTFWHNRSNYCGYFLRKRWAKRRLPLGILTSLSQEGEIAARTAKMSGLRVARGSVGGGGLAGLKALHRMVRREGISVLSVADGSRGPIYEAQAGVIVLAQTARAPLVPLSYVASRCWRLKSWDRMIVPKPFSRIAVAIGEPIEYPKRLDKETQAEAQAKLKATLDRLTEQAASAISNG